MSHAHHAFESSFRAEERRPQHRHRDAYLCYVARGDFGEQDRRGSRGWCTGEVVGYPADYAHMAQMGARGCTLFHVRIASHVDPRLLGATDCRQLAPALVAARRDMLLGDPDADLAASSWVTDAIERLVGAGRTKRAGAERLERIRQRLADDPLARVRLHELARDEDIDPSHLGRAFRQRFGVTPGNFRRLLRVERAMRRLANSDVPLAQLALDLGFVDQAHFSRVFRRLAGVAPGRYRREVRG